jgi:hypothetical protein
MYKLKNINKIQTLLFSFSIRCRKSTSSRRRPIIDVRTFLLRLKGFVFLMIFFHNLINKSIQIVWYGLKYNQFIVIKNFIYFNNKKFHLFQ